MDSIFWKIWRKIESLKEVREGHSIKDKIIILIHHLLCLAVFPINKISYELNGDYIFQPPKFYLWDFYCKNFDGTFFCRKRTDDFDMVKSSFEKGIAKYFDIKSGVFVDLGSHIGKYAVRISKQLKNKGRVLAVEADKDNFNILLKNLRLNHCKNVIALNIACWSEDGEAKFYNHGIMKSNQSASLNDVVKPISETPIIVKAKKLDTIVKELDIKKVDFIKMDIEGAETEALKGMKNVFKSNPNIKMVFESWDFGNYLEKDKALLKNYGFMIHDISKGLKDGSQNNYLAVRI